MAQSKTFKIGEYAKGGVITVEIKGKIVTVIGKDWDMSKGTMKSSDQSNAKEFTRIACDHTLNHSYREVLDFLCDLTTSYYADQIMKWIESKIKFEKNLNWW
jgi:major membrane immunogen (membrane-anchored lipoprotein)